MKCIMCPTTSDADTSLNTKIQVTIDNKSYNVHLCPEHAENTTMSTVKSSIKKLLDEATRVVGLCKELGIDIGSIVGVREKSVAEELRESRAAQPAPVSPPAPAPVAPAPVAQQPAKKVRRSALLPDSLLNEGDKPTDDIYTNVETECVEGRGGQPIEIPKRIEGAAGTTDIHIVRIDDSVIQKKAKMLEAEDKSGGGYSRPCAMCAGKGTNSITKSACPRCKGSGIMI